MSKQSEAREQQGYTLDQRNCGHCAHFAFDMALPAWMAKKNAEAIEEGNAPLYNVDRHGIQKSFRCALGGFTVKKTATCRLFESTEIEP